jgi:hypothetical protein
MSRIEALSGEAYLRRVEELLADIDSDERQSLLAELSEQIDNSEDSSVSSLGTPEDFVAEYRRSAGLPLPSERSEGWWIATIVSSLAVPFGVLVLFSFGAQVAFGPFLLAIEWLLARISPTPLRIVWSVLAGVLVGEITYLTLADVHVAWLDGLVAIAISLVVAGMVTVLFIRTTRRS